LGTGVRELVVWRKARDLAVTVYKETTEGVFAKDYGLRDQSRGFAVKSGQSACMEIGKRHGTPIKARSRLSPIAHRPSPITYRLSPIT
jgi:hypothetical protein